MNKGTIVSDIFSFFICNDWVFENKRIEKFKPLLDKEEKETFLIDVE